MNIGHWTFRRVPRDDTRHPRTAGFTYKYRLNNDLMVSLLEDRPIVSLSKLSGLLPFDTLGAFFDLFFDAWSI
jgi:hypothetical protein